MDYDYKEVPFTGQRPSPWKISGSFSKFNDVPGRKLNRCSNTKSIDGEPPTPPPSPTGTFKYPALLRGSNVWPWDAIGTEIRKSTNRDTANPGDKKKLRKSQPQILQDFFVNAKPASGKTKIYLWSETKSINCPKLDPISLTRTDLARSLKASTSEIESLAKFSDIFVPKKSTIFLEAGDTKEDTNVGNYAMMSNPSTKDFDEILKHALSHDPVIAKHNSTPRIQRSMIFANRPKTVFPMKKVISDRKMYS